MESGGGSVFHFDKVTDLDTSYTEAFLAKMVDPADAARYADMLDMERPVHDGDLFSRIHPKMPLQKRAKIFQPFTPLEGFEDHLRRRMIEYVPKHELDADEEWALNRRLIELRDLTANSKLARSNDVQVSVEYFEVCTDRDNEAYGVKGLYHTVRGRVVKVDALRQQLMLLCEGGERAIPFADIYQIS